MPRTSRSTPGGYVYHALNRAVGRMKLFRKPEDYSAFLQVLEQALDRHPIRLLGFCIMPTHWHFVLWPETSTQMTDFLRWLTLTHSVRWHRHHRSTGTGHLYQDRFKSFPVEQDEHFYAVLRYVERNPLRAHLVERAESWRWSSLHARVSEDPLASRLAAWPVPAPADWVEQVNAPQTEAELEAARLCVARGRPYGSDEWTSEVVTTMGLQYTMRARGRPRRPADQK